MSRWGPGAAVDPAAQRRLACDLANLLIQLGSVDPSRWPGAAEQADWRQQWRDLTVDVRRLVVPQLDPRQAARAQREADDALAVAEAAPDGFVHGDLGGANVLLDPITGRLTGVLDWDSSGWGDPAVDLAALSVSIPDPVADLLADLLPGYSSLHRRAEAYAATFALQEAIFGLRSNDSEATASGLATYRSA